MLEEYKIEQPLAYKILSNAINNNKCSHAYLFDTKNYSKSKELVLSFAKKILCGKNHKTKEEMEKCHICSNIDKNIYSELKIITKDGLWIKKEQLLDLQNAFMTKGVESNNKVYIIEDVDCLNKASANSILKFLEEPQEGIIALLMTNNIHKLLDTILSRCQIINLKSDVKNSLIEQINFSNELTTEEEQELINNTLDFIYALDQKKLTTLVYTKELFTDKFNSKDKIEVFYEIMLLFYEEAINYKIKKLDFWDKYEKSFALAFLYKID